MLSCVLRQGRFPWGLLPVLALGCWRFFQGGWGGLDCLALGHRGDQPTICVDPYWLNQWLKNYAGGFTKRGLIGEVLRHILPGDLDLLAVTAAALLLLLLCCALLYWLIGRLVVRSRLAAVLLTCLLLLSPFGKSLAETALDPLQVCLILAASVLFTPVASRWRDGWLLVVYVLCSLIYEGCALLLLPYVLLLQRPGIGRWLPVGLAIGLLLVFQRSDAPGIGEAASAALRAVNPWTGQSLRYQDGGGIAASVGFLFNVKQEFSRYLQDPPRDTLARMARSLGVVLAYLLVMLTAMGPGRSPSRRVVVQRWLIFAPVALPFVLITHDWFRYGVILLTLALLLTAAEAGTGRPGLLQPEGWSLTPDERWALLPLSAMVVIGPYGEDVRKFLPHNYFHASLLMLAFAAAIFWLSPGSSAQAAAAEVALAQQRDQAD